MLDKETNPTCDLAASCPGEGLCTAMNPESKHQYEYVRLLGQGGMANVSLFRRHAPAVGPVPLQLANNVAGQYVAVKQARVDTSPEVAQRINQMFDLECENVRSLSSAHVVHVYGVETIAGSKSIVMEWVDGCTLGDVLRVVQDRARVRNCSRKSVVSSEFATRILRGLLLGLKDIHSFRGPDGALQCLVHRDLTPKNVLLSQAGDVKISDFGISRLGSGLRSYHTQNKRGTLEFLAPELRTEQERWSTTKLMVPQPGQCDETAYYDSRLDLYNVGLILFNLLVGEPFEDWRVHRKLSLRVVGPFVRERLAELKDIDPRMLTLVGDLLESDPELRTASAQTGFDQIRQLYFGAGTSSEISELVALGAGTSSRRDWPTLSRTLVVEEKGLSVPAGNQRSPLKWRLEWGFGCLVLALGVFLMMRSDSRVRSEPASDLGETPGAVVQDGPYEGEGDVLELVGGFEIDPGASPVERMNLAIAQLQRRMFETEQSLHNLSLKKRAAALRRLERLLSLYLQFVRQDESLGASPQHWRCQRQELDSNPTHPRAKVCVDLKALLIKVSSGSEHVEEMLWSKLGKGPQNAKLVEQCLEWLRPWKVEVVENLLRDVMRDARNRFSEGLVTWESTLKLEDGSVSGIYFPKRVPGEFRPEAWSSSLRDPVCSILDDTHGWSHVLPAYAQHALNIRTRYFDAYGDEWHQWLVSMRTRPGFYKSVWRRLVDLSQVASSESSLLDLFRNIVYTNGTIHDWSCDFESEKRARTLPFAALTKEILDRGGLARQLRACAAFLDAHLTDDGLLTGLAKLSLPRIRGKYARLESMTRRRYEGSRKGVYEAIMRSFTANLAWGRERLGSETKRSLENEAHPSPDTFSRIENSSPEWRGDSRIEKEARHWCEAIQRPFEKRFAGRYPFVKDGDSFVPLDDIVQFFRPQTGTLWSEVAKLKSLVAMNGEDFSGRSDNETGDLRLNDESLDFLQQARAFSEALFRMPDGVPQMSFELNFPASASVSKFQLRFGDQVHGFPLRVSSQRRRFVWPSSTGTEAALEADVLHHGIKSGSIRIDAKMGVWSVISLVERASVVSRERGGATLVWVDSETAGQSVVAELTPLDGNTLLFGPEWREFPFFGVLRVQLPRRPFKGDLGCSDL